MVTALQENPTPEFGSHRALEAANLVFGCRRIDAQLIKGSPERPQVSLNVLLASFSVECKNEVDMTPHMTDPTEKAREQEDFRFARSDLNVKPRRRCWRCCCRSMTCSDRGEAVSHAAPASSWSCCHRCHAARANE
nr:hypothetical protein [Bradyrhizobium sp. cf659]